MSAVSDHPSGCSTRVVSRRCGYRVGDRLREDVRGPAAVGTQPALACWFRSEESDDHVLRLLH
jgi:hypothetical protein